MKIIRYTLAIQWIMAMAASIIDFSFGELLLPSELENYLNNETINGELNNIVLLVFLILFIGVFVYGTIAFFIGKYHGFVMFISGFIACTLITPFIGPFVNSGLAEMLLSTSSTLTGISIILGYNYFKNAANQSLKGRM
jgi:hypothetical protein